jgi:hypothetical protein
MYQEKNLPENVQVDLTPEVLKSLEKLDNYENQLKAFYAENNQNKNPFEISNETYRKLRTGLLATLEEFPNAAENDYRKYIEEQFARLENEDPEKANLKIFNFDGFLDVLGVFKCGIKMGGRMDDDELPYSKLETSHEGDPKTSDKSNVKVKNKSSDSMNHALINEERNTDE